MDIDTFDFIYTYAVAAILAVMATALGWIWRYQRKDEPPCDDDPSPPP